MRVHKQLSKLVKLVCTICLFFDFLSCFFFLLIFVSWINFRFVQIEFPFWHKKNVHVKTIWLLNLVAVFLAILYGTSTLTFSWYNSIDQVPRRNVCEYFDILPTLHLQLFYAITFLGFPFQCKYY